MIDVKDMESRLADSAARVARVNRDGWMWEASAPAGHTRIQGISMVIASTRRRAGAALIWTGERIQGTTVRRATDPATI